ncbi:MAG: hypothetical protein DI596_11535 [Azospira oryzae]|nr:MAG: hypothetical protein DI596_11535 [Azospira oryzae]PZP77887.1 MAG: hypothetical protein DI593_11535 [Azospira oryzae]
MPRFASAVARSHSGVSGVGTVPGFSGSIGSVCARANQWFFMMKNRLVLSSSVPSSFWTTSFLTTGIQSAMAFSPFLTRRPSFFQPLKLEMGPIGMPRSVI